MSNEVNNISSSSLGKCDFCEKPKVKTNDILTEEYGKNITTKYTSKNILSFNEIWNDAKSFDSSYSNSDNQGDEYEIRSFLNSKRKFSNIISEIEKEEEGLTTTKAELTIINTVHYCDKCLERDEVENLIICEFCNSRVHYQCSKFYDNLTFNVPCLSCNGKDYGKYEAMDLTKPEIFKAQCSLCLLKEGYLIKNNKSWIHPLCLDYLVKRKEFITRDSLNTSSICMICNKKGFLIGNKAHLMCLIKFDYFKHENNQYGDFSYDKKTEYSSPMKNKDKQRIRFIKTKKIKANKGCKEENFIKDLSLDIKYMTKLLTEHEVTNLSPALDIYFFDIEPYINKHKNNATFSCVPTKELKSVADKNKQFLSSTILKYKNLPKFNYLIPYRKKVMDQVRNQQRYHETISLFEQGLTKIDIDNLLISRLSIVKEAIPGLSFDKKYSLISKAIKNCCICFSFADQEMLSCQKCKVCFHEKCFSKSNSMVKEATYCDKCLFIINARKFYLFNEMNDNYSNDAFLSIIGQILTTDKLEITRCIAEKCESDLKCRFCHLTIGILNFFPYESEEGKVLFWYHNICLFFTQYFSIIDYSKDITLENLELKGKFDMHLDDSMLDYEEKKIKVIGSLNEESINYCLFCFNNLGEFHAINKCVMHLICGVLNGVQFYVERENMSNKFRIKQYNFDLEESYSNLNISKINKQNIRLLEIINDINEIAIMKNLSFTLLKENSILNVLNNINNTIDDSTINIYYNSRSGKSSLKIYFDSLSLVNYINSCFICFNQIYDEENEEFLECSICFEKLHKVS